LTRTILVLVTVWLGHRVYRKLYTLIGGQHAEKFENHCFRPCFASFGKRLQHLLHAPYIHTAICEI